MFSNNMIIPKNFISLENYKTKTNPQTTTFCDQLRVDDPLALVLGQWTRSSLSLNDQEMDSTFSSFVNSTVCSNNAEDCMDKISSENLPMSSFVLPEPKNDSTYTNNENNSLLNDNLKLLVSNISSEETNKTVLQSKGKFTKR